MPLLLSVSLSHSLSYALSASLLSAALLSASLCSLLSRSCTLAKNLQDLYDEGDEIPTFPGGYLGFRRWMIAYFVSDGDAKMHTAFQDWADRGNMPWLAHLPCNVHLGTYCCPTQASLANLGAYKQPQKRLSQLS